MSTYALFIVERVDVLVSFQVCRGGGDTMLILKVSETL